MQNFTSQNIKWLFTDIDGVWTDCCIYYSAEGEELKKFSYRDGMGVERLRKFTSIQIAIITGENSPMVARRAEKLKIDQVFLGVKNKLAVIEEFIKENNLTWNQIAYIGDDMNDFDAMTRAGLKACPADAFKDILSIADYQCKLKGGEGAFREFCEFIINSM
jgi:3-deoxy-D-manno-octulosonate 8-phosphate phosphatase (KDO 8-P phosphatase)